MLVSADFAWTYEHFREDRCDGTQQRESAMPAFVKRSRQLELGPDVPVVPARIQPAASVVMEIERNGTTIRVDLPLASDSAA